MTSSIKIRDIYDYDTLLKYSSVNEISMIFFWKNFCKGGVSIDKSCLSQWYYSPFTDNGVKYLTSEHFMIGKKALLFNDKATFDKVLKTIQPCDVKVLGKKIKDCDEDIWCEKCFNIIVHGNYHKFNQNHKLKEWLSKTGEKVLVQASPMDSLLGIGLSEEDSRSLTVKEWRGKNLLGFALMKVREMIKCDN